MPTPTDLVLRRLTRIEHLLVAVARKQGIEIQELHMAADQLQAAFDELKAKEQEAVNADVAGAAAIKSLREKLEAIPAGTTLTPEMLTELTNDLATHTGELVAASA